MRSVILLPILLLLLISCRIATPSVVLAGMEENPFANSVVLAPDDYDGTSFTFLYFTDAHINREKHEGDKISRFDESFFRFLDDGDYRFVVSGGDMSDDGEVSLSVLDFRKNFLDRGKILIEAVGNHDRHTYHYQAMDLVPFIQNGLLELDVHSVTYLQYLQAERSFTTGRYSYGDVLSLYVLDSSMRTFSAVQFDYLEDALENDPAKYRIVISHDNIVTGGVLDQSLFMTGFADLAEVTRYIKVLEKGNVSLVVSGHHHRGNILYGEDSTVYTEFNAAAYHRSDSPYESSGWWYTFTINPEEELLILHGYDAESGDERLTKTFHLKSN